MGALKEGGPKLRDVPKNIVTQIGDDAFAQPVDEVKARRAGNGEYKSDDDEHREVAIYEDVVVGSKSQIDHAPHS